MDGRWNDQRVWQKSSRSRILVPFTIFRPTFVRYRFGWSGHTFPSRTRFRFELRRWLERKGYPKCFLASPVWPDCKEYWLKFHKFVCKTKSMTKLWKTLVTGKKCICGETFRSSRFADSSAIDIADGKAGGRKHFGSMKLSRISNLLSHHISWNV